MDLDAYDSPDAEALLTLARARLRRARPMRRELITHGVAAAVFVAAAVTLAAVADWQRPLSLASLLLVVGTWIAIERVRFPVADGFTFPTMLAFVPALFVLPTPIVPLVAIAAVLARAAPGLLKRRVPVAMLPSVLADAWFTLGPALVIVLAGAQRFAWSRWPVYAGALAAELAFDMAATLARCWLGERIPPRIQLPLLSWLYLSDLTLAPLGLAIAAVAVRTPALTLIALAPTVNLSLFARERRQRMDETLALSTAYRGTAMLLGDIVEADDHYTGVHSRDVVELSTAVARELRLSARQQRDVEFAALLHDVGKIRIPKEIINKPGALDHAEWELVRRHTIDGERMLQMVGGALAEVGRIVRASHERYDGGGYPDGLAGEQIPIEARIICACDAYSAMTSGRAYRPAMTHTRALAELRRCAGRHFDPYVVAAIERILTPAPGSWLDVLAFSMRPGQAGPIAPPPDPWSKRSRPLRPEPPPDARSEPPPDARSEPPPDARSEPPRPVAEYSSTK